MKSLKKMLRKHERPLQQVVRRYNEQCMNESIEPIIPKKNYLTSKKPDCFILTNLNEIVQITEIKRSKIDQSMIIIGNIFHEKEDLFIEPLKSSLLNVYVVNNLSEHLNQWSESDIKNKMIVFNFKNKLTAVPILHHH